MNTITEYTVYHYPDNYLDILYLIGLYQYKNNVEEITIDGVEIYKELL
jgi:hypothetical protein